MTDADALLAAVRDRPDDDLPRLVLADYLDDHDDPDRAEFVRVQCELARLPADSPRRPALAERESELLAAHRLAWRIPGLRGEQRFRRGFVERVSTAADWLLAAADAAALAPIRTLRLSTADHRVADLVRLPLLARVEALDLRNNHFGAAGRLDRLLSDARLDRLRALSLQNNHLWPEGLEPLARSPVAARLTRLDVSGNRLGDAGLKVLATAPGFAGLRELVARSDEMSFEYSFHADGANALAGSGTLTRLRVLDLGGHYLGDAGVIDLVRSPNAARLELLDVSANDLGALGGAACEAIVASPHLGRLRRLHLGGNPLDIRSAAALATWPRLAGGLVVDLTEVWLGPAERGLIEASPWAGKFVLDP